MKPGDPADPPASYQVHPQWLKLLEQSGDWLGLLHLGVARVHAGDLDRARLAFAQSIDRAPSAWAFRGLAALDMASGNHDLGAENYHRALALAPGSLPLAVEAVQALVSADKPVQALAVIDGMPTGHRASGRVQLAEARSGLAVGDLDRVGRLLADGITIADVLEGEASLDELWFAYHEARVAAEDGVAIDGELRARVVRDFPLPRHYDFRMASA